MSEVIDSRIVEMRFDNSQFESNVRESMRTIDNLKSSLNFEGSVKGLDKLKFDIDASGAIHGLNAISDAASDCDLSALNNSAESVKLSFSALEVVAVTALGKIASTAIDAGAKVVKAFAVQPMTDGFSEYNQQLQSTRVIVSNTGQSLEEVTRVLDNLNVYADKTIYNFGDMTQAMGYFTAALGEKSAENSAIIAKGITNWAASTGQGAQVAKRVMYQVSQALSTDAFKLMDWKSIENTGAMAGKRYRDYFLETASEIYNVTVDDLLVDKQGRATSFRGSLETGWLSTEVFLKTMEKFASGVGDFKWMEEAATEVLTFSDLMDTVREQLGTGWGETWKIVFGTYEDSIKFYSGISDTIGKFINHVNDARNAIFQKWSDKGGRKLLFGISKEDTGAVGKILDGILNLLTQVHDGFVYAFGTEFLGDMLYGATELISKIANGFEKFTKIQFISSALRSIFSILKSALGSIFSILKSIISVLGNLYKITEPFIEFALSVIEKILQGVGKVAEVIANTVSKISEKFNGITTYLLKPFQDASNFITDVFGKALDFVVEKISSLWNFLKMFDIFGIMGGIEDSIPDNSQEFSDNMIEASGEIAQASESLEDLNKNLEKTGEALDQAGHKVSITVDGLQLVNKNLDETNKTSREVTGTWWDLISDTDKQRYFAVQYWDDLTEAQKEGWKQYALGLNLFTEEELRALENSEKSIDNLLDDRDRLINKKRKETQTWWDLIDEDKKKQYFAGQFWDDLTDEQREAWRKRAEEYNLYDPEEYARLLSEMNAAEQAAFSPENTQEIEESASGLENWFKKASKIPVVGGFLEKVGWAITKTVKNSKSFASAVGTSFGGFFNYIKQLNNTEYTFSEKFGLAARYFKENVADYLGQLVVKNFKTIGDVLGNTTIVSKLTSFTSAVKDRFKNFKDYVSDLNKNANLTFPEKFRLSLDYFKSNVVDYLGELVGKNLKSIGEELANNKIISNITSLVSAGKTKFGEFKAYIADLNANTELTFPEKLERSIFFLKTNVVDYFLELINKNLKSIGIDIEQIGKDISQSLTNAVKFVEDTLNKFGINTETLRKFFWNDDGTLKSIPAVITDLGNKIENAINSVKTKLRSIYEGFFPSTEDGMLAGPLGWLANLKSKVDDFIASIFGTKEELEKVKERGTKGGLLQLALETLGITDSFSLIQTAGSVISALSFGKSVGISGKLDFSKIAIGVALAAGAFALLSKVDFSKLGIDFKGFTDYFKDGEGNLLSASEIFNKVGQSISNSKLVTWVGNTAQLIGKNFSSAFDLLKEKSRFFGDFLKVINESDLSFPQKFGLTVRFFKDHFVIPFGELTKKNLKTIGIDIDGFIAKFKGSEGEWLSIGDILEKVGNRISGVIEQVKTRLENTKLFQWISGKFEEFKSKNPEIVKWFDSFGDTVSKVGNWIGDTAQIIGRNTSAVFTVFGEKFEIFKEHLKSLNENTELTFPEKFKKALEYFRNDFIIPFGILAKQNLKTIGIDIDAFVNYFKDNEGNWLSVGKIIEKVGTDIKNAFNDLKTKFEQTKFAQWFNEKFEWIKTKFRGVSDWFGNFSRLVSRFVVPAIAGAGIALALSRVGQLFDFIRSIGQLASGRTPELRAEAFATRMIALAGIIKDVSVAIMMIAGTIAGLSLLNQDELARATESLVNVIRAITVFTLVFGIMSRINFKKKEDSKEATTAILEITASIFLIATAFKIITTIPLERDKIWQLVGSFVILGLLMGMVAAFAKFSPKLEGSKSSFLGMVGIATAVLEMVGALYLVQLMLESHRGIGWALITLFGIVGMLALLGNAAKSVSWKAGVGLILMANSVRTMIGALERVVDSDILTKFNKDNWWQNLLKIVMVFASIYALAGASRIAGGGRAGLSLVSIAASVWILVQAIEAICDIPIDKMGVAIGVVTWLTVIMGAILVFYSHFNKGYGSIKSMIATSVQLYSVVIGVILLCAAVAVLSTLNQSNLVTSAIVVGLLTAVVGAIAIFLGKVSENANFGKALGLLGIVTIVAALMGGLIWALDHYIPDKSNLMSIAGSVSLLTGIIGAFAIFLAKTRINKFYDFGKMAGALVSMVAVLGLVSLIFGVLVNNFPKDMNTELLWSIAGAIAGLTVIVGLLSWLFGSIVNIDFKQAFKAAGAMLLFGAVIELLFSVAAMIVNDQGIDAVDKVVSVVERIGSGLAKMFDSFMSSVGKVSWDKLLVVVGGVLGAMFILGNLWWQIGVAAGILIGAVGAVLDLVMWLAIAILQDNEGKNAETLMNVIIPALERIGKGLVKAFEIIANTIGKLNFGQAVAAIGGIVVLGVVAPLLGLTLGVFAIEMAIAAGIVATLIDISLPAFALLADEGIPIFEKIASGIVHIASIIMDGIVANVETIIQCLRDFTNFAVNDFDAAKVGEAVVIAGQLTEVIGAFVGDNFLDMLGKFIGEKLFGETNRAAFEANIGCLTGVLTDFKTNVSSWTPVEYEKIQIAADIAQQLTEVCNNFTGTGFIDAFSKFLSEEWFGATHRSSFTTNMQTIGEALRTFCTEVNSIPSLDLGKAYLAVPIAEKMIELVKKFAPENVGEAFWQWFSSLSFNSDTFKNNIKNLSSAVSTFCGEVENWKVPTDYKSKFEVVDALIEFVDEMPSLDNGRVGIDQFGEMVKTFGESFLSATYYLNTALSKSDITNYDEKLTVIDDLIEISEKLPPAASAMGQFFGYNVTQTLGQFADDISVFGNNLKAFAESMNDVAPITDWDTKKTIIGQLIEFANLLPKDSSELEKEVGYGFQMDFAAFGEDIEAFAKSFNIVVDEINKLSITEKTLTKYHQMQGLVEELAALSKQLPQAFSQTDTTGNFSTVTSTFTQSFSDFMESILGNADLLSLNGPNFSNSLFDRVNQIYEEIDKLGEFTQERKNALDSLTSEDGVLRKLSDVAKNLPDFSNDDTKLGDFGLQIQGLAVNLTQAANTLSGDGTEDSFKFDPKPLEDLGKGVNSIISAFEGIETEKLGHVSSIMQSISGLTSGGNNGSGLGELLSTFVGSFLGDPFKNISEAQSNSAGVGGILSNISGLGDLLNNITGEGGLDLTGLTQIFGTAGTDGTASGGVMSLIPSAMTSFVSDMPEIAEVTSAKESLTSMFTGLNFDFSSLGPLMGNFSQGTGFDDTGIIQMMPTEIQDFITNMSGEGGSGFDLTSVNQMLTDLTSGITEAGSITPDMAVNFNTTLAEFADNGISAYIDAFDSSETDTKMNNAGKSIIEKTGKGIQTALDTLPNTIQTSAKAAVKFISDILSGDTSNPYDAPGSPIITKTGAGIKRALSSSSAPLKDAVKTVVRFIVNILSGNDDNPYGEVGLPVIMRTANGITSALNSSSYLLKNASKTIVRVITDTLTGRYDNPNPYEEAGKAVLSGFIFGMSNTDSVYTAAYTVGQKAVLGLKYAIQSNSPSKEAMKYGEYFSEGFGIGIGSYGNSIKATSEEIGNDALFGLASYVGKVYDLLDSDLDINPTITPVIDLSEIQNGVNSISAMFSRQQAYSANAEVDEVLRARSEAIAAASSTTDNSRTIGEIIFNVYTQGTDANAIARQVGAEVNRRLRAIGSTI